MLNGTSNYYWKVIGIAGALAGLVAWPGTGQATTGVALSAARAAGSAGRARPADPTAAGTLRTCCG